jgi:tetratricopeptide (TPR) repeat protein
LILNFINVISIEFNLALADLEKLSDLLGEVRTNTSEYEDPFYKKLFAKTLCKKYALYCYTGDYEKALGVFELLPEYTSILDLKTNEKIEKDRKTIEQRKLNEETKSQADDLLKSGKADQAREIYLNILKIEPNNEKVLSNLSLIYLFTEDYEKVTKYCTDILRIIRTFKERISLSKYDNSFELKILLRRAKSFEKLGQLREAQEDIETAERIELRNDFIGKDISEIKQSLKLRVLNSYKETANNYLEKGQFTEALEYYDKAISLTKNMNKLDAVKIYLNRSSCLVKLGQHDNVTNECTRLLSILARQKNIAIINSNIQMIESVKNLEFLTLIKRAYSYTSLDKVYEAKQDYEKALLLQPGNQKIINNLNILNIK